MTDKPNSIVDLIKALFYEAGKRTGKPDTKNAMANDIRKWLMNNRGFNVSERTLTRQYDRYILQSDDTSGAPPSSELQDEYAIYLGYENYNDFILKTNDNNGGEKSSEASPLKTTIGTAIQNQTINTTNIGEQTNIENQTNNTTNIGEQVNITNNSTEDKKTKKRNNWILYVVIFIALVTVVTLWYLKVKDEEKLCLFWKENHFESMECENATEVENDLIISSDEWHETYKDFRKIHPTNSTRFFDTNGKAQIWYQYRSGEYEFFNQPGTHPLNGKKLLPVNTDVVETYLKSLESQSVEPSFIEPITTSETFEKDPIPSSLPAEMEESMVKKGKYCFRNDSDQPMTTHVQAAQKPNERINLQPNEQVCILLPEDYYSYSAYINGQVLPIKQGKFTVNEYKEGLIRLTIPKESLSIDESTTPETERAKDCSKGDFCVKNTTGTTLTFRLNTKEGAQYSTLTVHSGKTECLYDIPSGVYNANYNYGVLTVTNMKYTNIRVVGCETGEKVF